MRKRLWHNTLDRSPRRQRGRCRRWSAEMCLFRFSDFAYLSDFIVQINTHTHMCVCVCAQSKNVCNFGPAWHPQRTAPATLRPHPTPHFIFATAKQSRCNRIPAGDPGDRKNFHRTNRPNIVNTWASMSAQKPRAFRPTPLTRSHTASA